MKKTGSSRAHVKKKKKVRASSQGVKAKLTLEAASIEPSTSELNAVAVVILWNTCADDLGASGAYEDAYKNLSSTWSY